VHVDHDDATDAVRELFCFDCNGGLGQFKDDPAVLRAAASTSRSTGNGSGGPGRWPAAVRR
jgi:hypothetical protein